MTLRTVLNAIVTFAWVATLAVGKAASALEPPFTPPTAVLVPTTDFQGVHGIPTSWQAALGTWQADGQTYNSIAATSAAVTTIFEYQIFDPSGPDIVDRVFYNEFTVAARLRNQQGGASTLVGLVYAYVNPANYKEVAFSPTGVAYLRFIHDGQIDTVAAATYPGAGQGMWFRAELKISGGRASLSVNGVPVFANASINGATDGQVGLSSYNTTAKFNKVSVTFPFGQQPFTEDFSDGVANGFLSPEGTFVVSNGAYVDTAVHATGEAFAPVDFGVGARTLSEFTVHVRMLNPYGNRGNLVGIVFDSNHSDSYNEVVFSPLGVAQLRRVVGNTIQVLKSAPHTGGRNAWFEVTFTLSATGSVSVNVNGEPVFANEVVPLFVGKPETLALITHWTPGRFDDFSFRFDPPVRTSLQTFDGPISAQEIRSGTWDTQGGTLNTLAVGVADIALPGLISAQTDYRYRGRLLNRYANSGNRVGLVFSYSSPEDYLEAVFAPTGQAYLNLIMEGTRYLLATGTQAVPRNVWFDVEIIRKGTTATVTVNGKPTFQNVQVGQLDGGFLGVVSRFTKGSFDNLATKEVP